MKRFTLYGSPHSLPTYKVALMLRLSGAPFSFRYVSFQRGMHKTPEFLALSRWSQVPVLVDDGRNPPPIGGHCRASGRDARPVPGTRSGGTPVGAGMAVLGRRRVVSADLQLLRRSVRTAKPSADQRGSGHRRLPSPAFRDRAFNAGFPPRRPRLSLRRRTYHRGPVLLWRRRLRGNLRVRFKSLGERDAVGKESDGAGWLRGALRNAGHGRRRVLPRKSRTASRSRVRRRLCARRFALGAPRASSRTAAPRQKPSGRTARRGRSTRFGAARKMHHSAGPALGSAAFSGRIDGLIRSRTIWKTT